MSEKQNRENRDFSIYDSMKTEDLEEILRSDFESNLDEEADTELLLYVMEVLAKRNRDSNTPEITAQQAWESFQENYLPEEENSSECLPKKSNRFTRWWPRRMIAAAAIFAIIVCVPVVAKSFSWKDIWNAVATWAKETFSFVGSDNIDHSEPATEDTLQFESLQQALAETDQSNVLLPTWMPDGYHLEAIKIDESPERKIFNALYTKNDQILRIFVQTYLVFDPENIEIEDDPIEIYEVSGVKYYIFKNVNQLQIVWHTDSYECCISCELSIEEIKMMIDSIGKG